MSSWWLNVPADKFREAAKQRDTEMRSDPEWRKPSVRLSGKDVQPQRTHHPRPNLEEQP